MPKEPSDEISDIAGQAFASIFNRKITQEEYLYLLSRYPFIEVCDDENRFLDNSKLPKRIVAKNGWQIFDYGNAMFASGNEFLNLAHRKQKALEEGEDEGGNGTIVQQFTDVAFLVIQLAKERGWNAINLLNGYYPMLRMAWIAAEIAGIKVENFEPTVEDYVVYNWVDKMKRHLFYPPEKPIVQPQLKA
jgi:hypothetical protein